MVNEFLMIGLMAASASLFAIGGTGWKPARRFGIPLMLLATAYCLHIPWLKCLLMALSLCFSLHLGYGDRTKYWMKALVFTGYGLPFLFIGWTWWVVITPVVCFCLFALSNWKYTAGTFFWKGVEFFYGLLIALTFIDAIK